MDTFNAELNGKNHEEYLKDNHLGDPTNVVGNNECGLNTILNKKRSTVDDVGDIIMTYENTCTEEKELNEEKKMRREA